MPTEADVMKLFERANPVPDPDALDIVISADQRLATVMHEERSTMTVIEPTRTGTPGPDRRRWVLPAAAAAVLVVVLVAGLAIFGDDDTTPSDTVPPTTPAPTPTTVPEESAAEPTAADLAVIDAFFRAYNDGDTDAVLAMLAEGAVVTEFDSDVPYVDWDQRLAWNHAQGEILTDPACTLPAEQPTEGATLLCTYDTLDAVVQAADGRPIPTSTYFTVVGGEFAVIDQRYRFPDFATLGTPFTRWMEENHPEVTGALFHGWTSREEALEHGRLRAEWAEQWARSLSSDEEATVLGEAPMAAPLPAAADGETQESIVGDITWTRIDGDASTQPQRVDFTVDDQYYGIDVDGISWQSPDGISWEKIEPFAPVGEVVEAGGSAWASAGGLVRWDGADFVPFDLPPSSAPSVDGLIRSRQPLSLAPFGDQLAVLVTERYSVPWSDILGDVDWFAELQRDGTIDVRNVRNGFTVQLDVIVDETEPGRIHLRDGDQPVASIGPWRGLDADSLIMSLDDLWHHELLIGDDQGFTSVPLPELDASIIDVVALGERLVLLGRMGDDDAEFDFDYELWAGTLGADWQRLTLPAPASDQRNLVAIASDGESLLLTIVSGGRLAEAWHTSDGETWRRMPSDAVSGTFYWPTDFGWMTEEVFEESGSILVSPDGITWQEIAVEQDLPGDEGNGAIRVFGSTIVISDHEDFGNRTMWVGRVEPG